MELCGDLGVGVAQDQETQYVELALGEVVRGPSGLGLGRCHPLRGCATHGIDEMLAGQVIEEAGGRAGMERVSGRTARHPSS